MKVFDRYIVRELLKPLICAASVLIFLILVADLFDNLDEFLRYKTPLAAIIQYYLALIPLAFIQILPWSAWISTMFLLVNFGVHNEIIAMKAAGLKITTIIKPIFFLGFLLGIFSFLVSDRIVPVTHRIASDLKAVHIEKEKEEGREKDLKNVTYLSKNGQLYYFRNFFPASQEVRDVIGLWLDPNARNTRRKMMAKRGLWTESGWIFYEVLESQMDSRGRILGEPKAYAEKQYAEINFTPRELASISSDTAFLSYRELKASIRKLKENGVHVHSERVDLQSRLSFPWAALVMMMLCVPLLARTTNRRVIALNVLACMGLVFVFHVIGAVGIALGKAGKIFPFLSAWMGNIAFSMGSLIALEKANH